MSEVHVQLGDAYAHLDRDDESEQHYVLARDTCVKARELCAEVVSEELVATMEELVSGVEEE